jgi:hypothetical protein
MREGPFKESSYYYPGERIQAYMESLGTTEIYENQFLPAIDRKIAILTHDDEFDPEMFRIERSQGIRSTWFVLAERLEETIPPEADVHLHFDKEKSTLGEQIETYRSKLHRYPRFNRIHRLLWRANNFDFPLLAMSGIQVDSTLIGERPYRPTIEGRVLPIWEVPFSIADRAERFMACYSIAADSEVLFKDGLSPITILSHPFSVCARHQLISCFYEVLRLIRRYHYQSMDMTSFYDQFLRAYDPCGWKGEDHRVTIFPPAGARQDQKGKGES